MSYENVKKYFDQAGMGDRVVVREHIGDTVEHAAQAIGCKPEHIVKTMSFLLDGKPALICMAGDAKVNNTKYKACFHQKAVMIPGDQVEELVGHVPGAVCPFAVCEDVKVYLDISLKRFSTIYTAGGSLNSTVKLTLKELEKFAAPRRWVDVCKGWFVNENLISKAYSPEEFKKDAPKVMGMISRELEEALTRNEPETIRHYSPEEQLRFWQEDFSSSGPIDLEGLMKKVMPRSINFHSKGYVGHQVAVTLPVTALTSAMMAYMNNCTTVYELGMAGNAMEKVVISHLAEKFGYNKGAVGFVVSGGSMGNLTALVTARSSSGIEEKDYDRLAVMVSGEAHYSVERAAKIMGIRSENIIKVPVGDDFGIRAELLESIYQQAVSEGKMVFCVVGCACTTSVGAFDDLEAIADFASRHQLWFHVDGAHGGAVVFSDKYKFLIKGIERSDSLIVDFHKMMMTPPLSTAIIYNSGNRKVNEFSPKAAYLWQDQLSQEWWNSAKHTLECTKPITILHTYAIMRLYGDQIYEQNVDMLFDMGKEFSQMIKEDKNMELAMEPKSNIVCFRYVPEKGDADQVNRKISEKLLEDGAYYVVSTTVGGKFYLRVTIMNPFTDRGSLERLIAKIKEFGEGQAG